MYENQRYFNWANTEEFASVKGVRTNRDYFVRKFTYGVLVPDKNHPLSCVSVSNSSLSIDLWSGCGWQCKYCHVQGTMQDLGDNNKMAIHPIFRSSFSVDEIIDQLVEHPFFVKDKTVISIGTASTEPFAIGPVCDSTFEIMEKFIQRGLQNPFWIVTKAGIPRGRKQDIARICSLTRGLMISICWADNPDTIEPVKNNRFNNCEEAKEAGAIISWYMRPIVPEWSGTPERIEMMMLWVSNRYRNSIDMIVPGGLRWTEGIEYGLTEINGLSMPDIPRDDNIKSLSDELWFCIKTQGNKLFPKVPIYHRSSCALTNMLKAPSITGVQMFSSADCENSICPTNQRRVCAKNASSFLNTEAIQCILNNMSIPAKVIKMTTNGILITDPPLSTFTYAIRKSIENRLIMEVSPSG